jgi:diguanylate cyclase (GGDEF)-like protein
VHSAALGELEQFLETLLGDVDAALNLSLNRHLTQVRQANRRVIGVLQRASGQLSCYVRFCGQLLAKEKQQVDQYRHKTADLEEILAAVEGQAATSGHIQQLTANVQDLQNENTRLRRQLDDCQKELAEQMAAADAAAANVRVDVMTQLPNRRAFEEGVAGLQEEFERDGEAYAVAFLDVDNLQDVNQQHGSAVGDAALAMLGRVFRETQRTGQRLARFDGDQFALLLSGYELEQAAAVAENFREKVENACLRLTHSQVRVTASVGVARACVGEPRRGTIVRAQAALTVAQQAGGNRVCVDQGAAMCPLRLPPGVAVVGEAQFS